MQWLSSYHLKDRQKGVTDILREAAMDVLDQINDSPQTTLGLQHLIDAKDCFVRSSLATDPPN